MARNDDSQPGRVYKASDVHRRRVDRKGHPKEPKASRPVAPPAGDRLPIGEPASSASGSAQEPSSPQAVVITPEFGKRTQAQREADDRWFAAMRESVEAEAPESGAPASETAPMAVPMPDAGAAAPRANPAPTAASVPALAGAAGAHGPAVAGEGEPGERSVGERPQGPAGEGGGKTLEDASPGAVPNDAAPASGSPAPNDAAPASGSPAPNDAPAASGAAPASGRPPSQADGPGSRRPAKRPPALSKRGRRIALVACALVLVAAVVAASLFAWNRWYRFDDHADMQGTWYVVGTTVPVSIGEGTIQLTDKVSYAYELNPHDKTISYSLGTMQGQGRYWFSDDRQYLVITDGDEFTGTSTAIDDLLRSFAEAADSVTGAGATLPEGEGIIAFSREPDPAALKREQEEAAKKAAEEAAARQEAERIAAEQAAAEAAEAAAWEAYYYGEDGSAEEAPAEDAPEEAPLPAEGAPSGEPSEEG